MTRTRKPFPHWQFMENDIQPQELAKQDNFIVSLMVESLVYEEPLKARKLMWPNTKPPKPPDFEKGQALDVIKKHVCSVNPLQQLPEQSIRESYKSTIDALLELPQVTYYLQSKSSTTNRDAFATHLAQYCMLYQRNGLVEIASTNQFVDWTGELELSLVATEWIAAKTRIPFLTSPTSPLSQAQEAILGRDGEYGPQDFSIFTQHNKKSRLLLGPVRFANHDCNPNAMLTLQADGRTMCICTIKNIPRGAEITVSYGGDYFGKKNGLCLCMTCREQKKGGYRYTKQQWEWHMHNSASIQGVLPPVARVTSSVAERESDQRQPRRYSRELKAIVDRTHFQHHPSHDTESTHSSTAMASRSTSVTASTTRKTVGSTVTRFGTDLEMVPEVSSGDEESAHGDPHPGGRTQGRTTASPRTGMGGEKRKRGRLTQSDNGERLTDVMRLKTKANTPDVGNCDEQKGIVARGSRCTRSKLGRTARPETTDAGELCIECEIRARTPGAQNCARCRRHAQIYGHPWPTRYELPPVASSSRYQLKRKCEGEPRMSCPKKRARTDGSSSATLASKRVKKTDS